MGIPLLCLFLGKSALVGRLSKVFIDGVNYSLQCPITYRSMSINIGLYDGLRKMCNEGVVPYFRASLFYRYLPPWTKIVFLKYFLSLLDHLKTSEGLGGHLSIFFFPSFNNQKVKFTL